MASYRLNPQVIVSVNKKNGMILDVTIRKTTKIEKERKIYNNPRMKIVVCFEDDPEYVDSQLIASQLYLSQDCVEHHIKALEIEGYVVDVTEEYDLLD